MCALSSCHCCGLVQTLPKRLLDQVRVCHRCRTPLHVPETQGDNAPAAAVSVAALILLFPALTLPFLQIEHLGHSSVRSLLGGTRALFESGAWFVGSVVLVFSVILPPTKLVALLMLSFVPELVGRPRQALLVYRAVEKMGRWGMVDVLLAAVLVAFVKLGDIVSFAPQPGLFVFGGFVLLSILSSGLFNPYYLWSERSMSRQEQPENFDAAAPEVGESTSVDRPAVVARDELPQAEFRRRRRWSWLWVVPILAAIGVAVAVYLTWAEQGLLITISFADGEGLKAGDALRYNGTVVGRVEKVRLAEDLGTVRVAVRLDPASESLARQGTLFWIVRPDIQLTEVTGLETLVGAKYLSALPGSLDGPRRLQFVGLEQAPLRDAQEPGGIDIVLQAKDAAGLRRGTPIYYRRLRIGGVRAVRLASDGSAVEAVAYIRPQFQDLMRDNTVFWNAQGVRLEGGLSGFSLHIGSLETLLTTGISVAVPPDAGQVVAPRHRYILHERPEEEWLQWKPQLAGGTIPEHLPRPRQAVLEWTHDGTLWDVEKSRRGWVLPVKGGWLGPADLLKAPSAAVPGSHTLRLAGRMIGLEEPPTAWGEDVALLPAERSGEDEFDHPLREASTPEDLLLVGDPDDSPLFVSAARLQPGESQWVVDQDLRLSAVMHGAVAVAVADGAVIGILLVDEAARPRLATLELPGAVEGQRR